MLIDPFPVLVCRSKRLANARGVIPSRPRYALDHLSHRRCVDSQHGAFGPYNIRLSQAAQEEVFFGSGRTEDEGLLPRQTQTTDLSQVRSELKRLSDQANMVMAQNVQAQQALKIQVEGIEQQVASVVSAVQKLVVKLDERP